MLQKRWFRRAFSFRPGAWISIFCVFLIWYIGTQFTSAVPLLIAEFKRSDCSRCSISLRNSWTAESTFVSPLPWAGCGYLPGDQTPVPWSGGRSSLSHRSLCHPVLSPGRISRASADNLIVTWLSHTTSWNRNRVSTRGFFTEGGIDDPLLLQLNHLWTDSKQAF